MSDIDKVITYLKEDRRTASLDVDKYASAITDQNKQMNAAQVMFMEQMKSQQAMFMKMFESLSVDVKGLAVKVEENTRVTLNFEAQRDTLTKCLIDIREEMKDTQKRTTALELKQAVATERQEAVKESGKEGRDWLKWVLGGFVGMVVTGAAALVKGMSS